MGSRFFNSILTLILCLVLVFFLGFKKAKAEIYPVDISHDSLGWHITPCPLPGVSGDTWRFSNSASDTIYLSIPLCVKKDNSSFFYLLAPGDSVDHLIHEWEPGVQVRVRPLGPVAYCRSAFPPYPTCPVLTQWGIIALIGLFIITTIYILTKRKRQTIRTQSI